MFAPILWAGYGRKLRPPAETLSYPTLHFDMKREIEKLRAEEAYRDQGHNGKTLVKQPDLRVVLSVVAAGTRVSPHRLHGATCLQVLDGWLRVRLPRRTLDVDHGQMLALQHDVPFGFDAKSDTAYLVTFSSSGGR